MSQRQRLEYFVRPEHWRIGFGDWRAERVVWRRVEAGDQSGISIIL